jgi:hypothetical protein
MPWPLDGLERIMEEAVEGSIRRLFRPTLQPVQLAKAAARRMDEQQVIGPSGPEVPNSYAISLHPKDFERFARYQMALQNELQKYLVKYARDHGWRPVSDVSVALIADSGVQAGRLKVEAQMLDTARDAPQPAARKNAPIEQTVRQRRVASAKPEAVELSQPLQATLLNQDGERFELARPVVTLGRALENDIVIADSRVSRFHAEIKQESGRFVLRDLGSTNGTRVASEKIDRRELRNGETISLGGYELTFKEI